MGRIDLAQISTILKTWQTLSNGEHPVVTKVYVNKKKKLFVTGLSTTLGKWDEADGRFKKNHKLNDKISELELKAKRIADNIISNHGTFSLEKFSREFKKTADDTSFVKFAEKHIEKLRNHDRHGTADSYNNAVKKFTAYLDNPNISVADIENRTFTGFMDFMKSNKQRINGIGIYMRSICAIYGEALHQGFVTTGLDARDGLKIKKENTAKRALSKENMLRFVNAVCERGRQEESRNMFVFSYFCQGINFKDLCALTWDENIVENRIVFKRDKTNKLFSVNINAPLRSILDVCKENNEHGRYLFPVYENIIPIKIRGKKTITEAQRKSKRNSRAQALNGDIRELAVKLNVIKLTELEHKEFMDYRYKRKAVPKKLEHMNYYAARHTYATVLKKAGVMVSIISEGLGHSSEKVTQTYLDAFENKQLDNAQINLE